MAKKSTIDAINNFSRKQLPRETKPRRPNQKPEKLVEKACLAWMREQRWSVNIFEAKATFNPRLGIWMNQAMKAGTADCLGTTETGHSVAIEFKAKGKLSTYAREDNYAQQKFIDEKIAVNCFACVVDSVERLQEIYKKWLDLRMRGLNGEAQSYLRSEIPKRKGSNEDDPIF